MCFARASTPLDNVEDIVQTMRANGGENPGPEVQEELDKYDAVAVRSFATTEASSVVA